jgi:hypothetical protein
VVVKAEDTSRMPATREKTIDWPVWWFVRLEGAVEKGDHQAAAEAQHELERLGVTVRYGRPRRQTAVAGKEVERGS